MASHSNMTDKARLQEEEYHLPIHWLLRKSGLVHYQRKTDLMAEMIKQADTQCGRVLDVGSGDGRGTYELASRLGESFIFEGVDFSERAIAFARLMAPNIAFEVQDGKSLPYQDESFKLIVSREVIEHIPPAELDAFLIEAHRVLETGGKILLTTPSEKRKVPEKHFQHFSPNKLRTILTRNGFAVTKIRGFGWFPSPRVEPFYRYIVGLPALWRIQVWLGTREMPLEKADCLLVLASKK